MILTGKLGAFGEQADEQSKIAKKCSEFEIVSAKPGVLKKSNEACPTPASDKIVTSSDSLATGGKCCVPTV